MLFDAGRAAHPGQPADEPAVGASDGAHGPGRRGALGRAAGAGSARQRRRAGAALAGDSGRAQENPLDLSLPDGTVWQLRRDVLADGGQTYIQIEASDITQLYRLSRELYENNRRLRALQERQKALLADIVQINREKELEDAAEAPQEAELLQVAGMIGCRVQFSGERPTDRGVLRLLYAAVREALTNAVRHAGADTLTVAIRPTAAGYHAEISSNGRPAAGLVREGDGLRNLRRRLEQEGASMQLVCRGGVVLLLELPCGAKTDGRRDG